MVEVFVYGKCIWRTPACYRKVNMVFELDRTITQFPGINKLRPLLECKLRSLLEFITKHEHIAVLHGECATQSIYTITSLVVQSESKWIYLR